jgi:cytochrome P450
MESQAKEAIQAHESSEKDDPNAKRNIFRAILANPSLPDAEKVYDRISQEGVVAIAAGGETTGRALATATFFLLENRTTLLPRLKEEIMSVMPKVDDRPAVKELEKLPLLTAIIKETLRLNGLLTSRFPLISPNQPLQYKDWVIPAGTPVSMTLRDVLNDPEAFEDPRSFDPDRWLKADADKLEHMNRNFVPFGRGSRMCLGIKYVSPLLLVPCAGLTMPHVLPTRSPTC